LAVLFSW
jgi:hypothetical protein